MLIQERLDSNPDQQEIVPSAPPEEMLDTLSEQSNYNRPETNDSGIKREFSSLSLANSSTERQRHEDKVQREIKGLKRMVTSLLHRLKTMQIQDSCQKNDSLPTAMTGSEYTKGKRDIMIAVNCLYKLTSEKPLAEKKRCKDFNCSQIWSREVHKEICLEYILLYHLSYSKN